MKECGSPETRNFLIQPLARQSVSTLNRRILEPSRGVDYLRASIMVCQVRLKVSECPTGFRPL